MINVTDFTVDGKCSGCGSCCGNFLPISASEIDKIKKYIAKHKIEEQYKCPPSTDVMIDGSCPFRNESERKCLIYPVRPWICRQFLCNQTPQIIGKNKYMANHRWYTVDLREVFYGHASDPMMRWCVELINGGMCDVPR